RAGTRVDVGSSRPRGRAARVRREARAAMETARLMRLSLALPIENATAIAECAAAIEAAGFDGCFLTDHPYPPRAWLEHGGHRTVDPFVALAAAATATATLRLHTHCYIPAYREPHLPAQPIPTLQPLSDH